MTFRRLTSQELVDKSTELLHRTEKNRKNMIESERSVIEVFCDRARTELRIGNRDRARDALCEAKKAVGEARLRLSELLKNPGLQRELTEQLEDLQTKLSTLEEQSA